MKIKFSFLTLFICFLLCSCKKGSNIIKPENLLVAKLGENAGIYDQSGRYIILRGVNYNVLGDYWQANPVIATQKQYEENDLILMAKYGVNCIRLLFSWSKLEPIRGQYNQSYIQEIKQVIETAAKYNIYVLLDMHQDAYSKFIATPQSEICEKPNKGWDGAPEWATITDGFSTCTADGSRESAPAVVHAWQNLWDNKNGIQDACIQAWIALVKQTANYPNVLGYDLINEPSLGYEAINIQADKLGKFYNKLIKQIREAENKSNGFNHIVFFEMSVTWNGQPIPFIPFPDFTDDKNIIFAPHTYFEAISYQLTIEQGFDLIKTLSKIYNSNMFVGEYGFFGNPSEDVNKLKRIAKKEDENLSGSTWWQWSQAPGDPHGISWDGTQYGNTSMHLIELDKNGNFTGNINQFYLNVLGRSRPTAICGNPIQLISNPDDGTMILKSITKQEGITTLWIPDRFGIPEITGVNILTSEIKPVNGGYLSNVKVKDNYTIEVSF